MNTGVTEANKTPRARLVALEPDRQAALLDPAEREFATHGFSAASLNRILAAAGISKGQAYYYISDKADLYAAVMERALSRLIRRVNPHFFTPTTPEEFWSQVSEFLDGLTDVLMTDKRLSALVRGIHETPDTRAALAHPLEDIREEISRAIVAGQSVGAVRSDVPLSLLSDVVFTVAREADSWFARHSEELTPLEALSLNNQAFALIRAMAAPPRERN